jgi:hypothetical protein
METVLSKPALHDYRIANHLEFHKQSYLICKKSVTVVLMPDLIEAYQKAVEQEEYVFNWVRKSDFTKKKEQADRRRNKIYNGMTGLVRAVLKHFDPAMRNCANHVYNLVKNYGRITNDGYDAQTASVTSIINRLRSSDYAADVQTLGLLPWLDELEKCNEQFKVYVEETMREQINKPNVTTTVARRMTDSALRNITTRVTSQINLGNSDAFAGFAEEFNVLVKRYNTIQNEHLGRLHARIDIAPANIAKIDPQPFTGKPVFVIPQICLKTDDGDTSELIFTEDFYTSYHNNVNPGTATVIITGTGRYNGKIVTTFNIVKNE